MVCGSSPIPAALHPNESFLGQLDRALVRGNHQQAHPPRNLPKRPGADPSYRELHSREQQRTQAIRLDRNRDIHSAKAQEI
jgi:hypothetical protein